MTHRHYRRMIDQFLDGKLDFVEVAELHLHENDCKRGCLGRTMDRTWERLDERNAFLPTNPQPCLKDRTWHRWFTAELPTELYPIVSEHLKVCKACRERSLDLAKMEADELDEELQATRQLELIKTFRQ